MSLRIQAFRAKEWQEGLTIVTRCETATAARFLRLRSLHASAVSRLVAAFWVSELKPASSPSKPLEGCAITSASSKHNRVSNLLYRFSAEYCSLKQINEARRHKTTTLISAYVHQRVTEAPASTGYANEHARFGLQTRVVDLLIYRPRADASTSLVLHRSIDSQSRWRILYNHNVLPWPASMLRPLDVGTCAFRYWQDVLRQRRSYRCLMCSKNAFIFVRALLVSYISLRQ